MKGELRTLSGLTQMPNHCFIGGGGGGEGGGGGGGRKKLLEMNNFFVVIYLPCLGTQ